MGKSYPSPPPIALEPTSLPEDTGPSDSELAMLDLIENMKNQLAERPTVSPPPEPSGPVEGLSPDEFMDEAAEKARKEAEEEAKKRRGLESTVLTSPLLEEEDPNLIVSGIFGV